MKNVELKMSVKSRELPLSLNNTGDPEIASARPWAWEKKVAKSVLSMMKNPPIAIELWDGSRIQSCGQQPEVTLKVKNRSALSGILRNPDYKLGDAYSTGAIDIDGDLVKLAEIGSTYRPDILDDRRFLGKVINFLGRRARPNTLSGSRHHIHHHYDLSNDFYQLWLDRNYMQYTCAYYENLDYSIEQAQIAKLHHVCRKLRLQPGDEVIEFGCGWGGLGLFMAKEYGARVKAYNISAEQIKYARDKAAREGLQDRLEYIEDDYRNAAGTCDVFVSVGMLEHVGKENYKTLGSVIDRCLRDTGRGLIHSIGRNKPKPMNRWIEKRIFPGAYPPTLGETMNIFEPYSLSVLDVENLRLHYAKTLEQWLARYESNVDKVLQMFDEKFVRAWRLYLSGSIAAFRTGELQLFQVVFQRPLDNDLPWTRRYLYPSARQV